MFCLAGLVLSACADQLQGNEAAPAPEATTATATAPAPAPSASATAQAEPTAASSSNNSTPDSSAPGEGDSGNQPESEATEPPARGTVETVDPAPAPEESTSSPQAAPSNSSSTQPTEPLATAAGTPVCDYGQIHVMAEVADGGGAAGSRYINLTFTNSGDSPCTVSGYPSVNYVDSSGNQIGATANQAAEWTSTGKVLAPGDSSTAILRETRAGLFDPATCQPETASGYRVTIPGTSTSYVLSFPAEACSNMSTSQLSVGQVGAQG